jgi:hypothetical protein
VGRARARARARCPSSRASSISWRAARRTRSALGRRRAALRFGVLLAAAGLAAAAVSVVGQILFVGLIVPHVVRLLTGARAPTLLPLSALGGGLLVLGADALQRALPAGRRPAPGRRDVAARRAVLPRAARAARDGGARV